jgi:hypothetical protein
MKIYKRENIGGKEIFCLMHWDFDMRSFQVNDNMVLLIQYYGDTHHINPRWRELIKGVERQFLEFLNENPYSWDVPSEDDIEEYIEERIEDNDIEYSEIQY